MTSDVWYNHLFPVLPIRDILSLARTSSYLRNLIIRYLSHENAPLQFMPRYDVPGIHYKTHANTDFDFTGEYDTLLDGLGIWSFGTRCGLCGVWSNISESPPPLTSWKVFGCRGLPFRTYGMFPKKDDAIMKWVGGMMHVSSFTDTLCKLVLTSSESASYVDGDIVTIRALIAKLYASLTMCTTAKQTDIYAHVYDLSIKQGTWLIKQSTSSHDPWSGVARDEMEHMAAIQQLNLIKLLQMLRRYELLKRMIGRQDSIIGRYAAYALFCETTPWDTLGPFQHRVIHVLSWLES